jgi:hypothetical protein
MSPMRLGEQHRAGPNHASASEATIWQSEASNWELPAPTVPLALRQASLGKEEEM